MRRQKQRGTVKLVIELICCLFHIPAMILIWLTIPFKGDMGFIAKVTWAVASIIPFVPFIYVLTDHDFV